MTEKMPCRITDSWKQEPEDTIPKDEEVDVGISRQEAYEDSLEWNEAAIDVDLQILEALFKPIKDFDE